MEDVSETVLMVAKQIVKESRDVTGGGCVKDTGGKIVVEDVKRIWSTHYDKISNEEFLWDKNALMNV